MVVVLINLGESAGHVSQRALVDQQEEGLCRVQLEAAPDDLDELPHRDVVRYQKLGLVEQWQVALTGVTLNDHWHFVGVLLADLFHITLPLGKTPSFSKWFHLRVHDGVLHCDNQ